MKLFLAIATVLFGVRAALALDRTPYQFARKTPAMALLSFTTNGAMAAWALYLI